MKMKENRHKMKDYTLKTVGNFRLEKDGWDMSRCKATCTYEGKNYEVNVMNPYLSDICTDSYEEQAIREIENGRAKEISKDELYEENEYSLI